MSKKSPKIEESALSNIQNEIETAGAESAEDNEQDVPHQLALKPKKSKKARSKAQMEAFARMRARKAEIDAKKREEKEKKAAEKPIVLQEYVSSAEEEQQEQKPAIRKKKVKKKKQVVYETESSSSDDEVVAVVKRRKAAKKKKKSNARVIFTDELDDSDDDYDKSLEQQYVDVPRQPQLVFL